ncbi:type II toxin-antitoxin system RelE/ParE family toxin [Turneriella parva]|uniref:Plasmid stabilization system n=1 Tax=Turneriella parva (strain ATCC BAA-1111 / DSM 21527 / NCTC 11395 / H) TaxID=869212 RepID=I4B9Y6_TURPD|nr:type II toxin-antitoxin system RelE/ParE family toxin [Turneriella parva]AFM14093.1 plasmid stabilization system [Turneriella parva DSM 21527]
MTYSFHPEAEAEFNHAIDYYEEREIGLGYDFAIEVHDSIQNILKFPEAWNPLGDGIRSCLTNRFPYGVIYSKVDEEIFILAIMHCHREPDYWRKRLEE